MGCWNATCGLSQMPIKYNDEVKMVLLISGHYHKDISTGSGFCHPDNMFKPLFFPVNGTYNDYGGIDTTENKQEVIDVICKYLSPNEVLDFDKLLEQVSNDKFPEVSFTLIHKEVYDKFIKLTENEKRFSVKNNLRKHSEEAVDASIEYIEYFENYLRQLGIEPAERMDTTFLHKKSNNEHYTRCLPMLYNSSADLKLLKALKDEAVDFIIMNRALDNARKFWSPQSSAGGQDVDYRYAMAIGSISRKFAKQDREDT